MPHFEPLPISIVIPALNEEKFLPATLGRIQRLVDATDQLEIIVADGGSTDNTVALARSFGARVCSSAPGRARQMNCGVKGARGEVLLFLHADTLLPPSFANQVITALRQPRIVAGAFSLAIDEQGLLLRLIERVANWRARFLQLPYGDQAIFLTKAFFNKLGGFPDLPIMEDVALVRQLRRRGKIAVLPAAVQTSGRRWRSRGTVATTFLNQLALASYLLGVAPERIQSWHKGALARNRPKKLS